MSKNKLLQYALLIASLFVTGFSILSAQSRAMAGQAINFFVHGLAFLFAILLIAGAIYLRTKDK